jgi:hypothetical protein
MLDAVVNPPGKHLRPHGPPNRERAPLTVRLLAEAVVPFVALGNQRKP